MLAYLVILNRCTYVETQYPHVNKTYSAGSKQKHCALFEESMKLGMNKH